MVNVLRLLRHCKIRSVSSRRSFNLINICTFSQNGSKALVSNTFDTYTNNVTITPSLNVIPWDNYQGQGSTWLRTRYHVCLEEFGKLNDFRLKRSLAKSETPQ